AALKDAAGVKALEAAAKALIDAKVIDDKAMLEAGLKKLLDERKALADERKALVEKLVKAKVLKDDDAPEKGIDALLGERAALAKKRVDAKAMDEGDDAAKGVDKLVMEQEDKKKLEKAFDDVSRELVEGKVIDAKPARDALPGVVGNVVKMVKDPDAIKKLNSDLTALN